MRQILLLSLLALCLCHFNSIISTKFGCLTWFSINVTFRHISCSRSVVVNAAQHNRSITFKISLKSSNSKNKRGEAVVHLCRKLQIFCPTGAQHHFLSSRKIPLPAPLFSKAQTRLFLSDLQLGCFLSSRVPL